QAWTSYPTSLTISRIRPAAAKARPDPRLLFSRIAMLDPDGEPVGIAGRFKGHARQPEFGRRIGLEFAVETYKLCQDRLRNGIAFPVVGFDSGRELDGNGEMGSLVQSFDGLEHELACDQACDLILLQPDRDVLRIDVRPEIGDGEVGTPEHIDER